MATWRVLACPRSPCLMFTSAVLAHTNSQVEDAIIQGCQLGTTVRLALVRADAHNTAMACRVHRQRVAAQQAEVRMPAGGRSRPSALDAVLGSLGHLQILRSLHSQRSSRSRALLSLLPVEPNDTVRPRSAASSFAHFGAHTAPGRVSPLTDPASPPIGRCGGKGKFYTGRNHRSGSLQMVRRAFRTWDGRVLV